MTNVGGIAKEQLESIIARIEKLEVDKGSSLSRHSRDLRGSES